MASKAERYRKIIEQLDETSLEIENPDELAMIHEDKTIKEWRKILKIFIRRNRYYS
jgi:hypothetical protein